MPREWQLIYREKKTYRETYHFYVVNFLKASNIQIHVDNCWSIWKNTGKQLLEIKKNYNWAEHLKAAKKPCLGCISLYKEKLDVSKDRKALQ